MGKESKRIGSSGGMELMPENLESEEKRSTEDNDWVSLSWWPWKNINIKA